MDSLSIFAVLSVIAIVVTVRIIAGGFDSERIDAHAAAEGWKVRYKEWAPFGPGWIGSQGPRIYRIRYLDVHGDEREAHLKTSMNSGVYMTKSRVISRAPSAAAGTRLAAAEAPAAASSFADLEEENRWLKQRIEELERGTGFQ